MQAVILAGGQGKRLRPLTDNIPKSMVSIFGRPYLEYQIRWLRENNIKEVLILVGYLGEKIISHFKDGSAFDVRITYSKETKPLGTGGGLRLAMDKLESSFFLIYGDSFLPINFFSLERDFFECMKIGMVVVYDNGICDTAVKNNVYLDKDSIVLKYRKDSRDSSDLNCVEAGVMIFKKKVIDLIPEGHPVSLEQEIFPVLIKKRELAGYISKEPFYDIGTPDRLERFKKVIGSEFFCKSKGDT